MVKKVKDITEHPNLKAYKQLGVKNISESGSVKNIKCDCPFCGKKQKLYVNVETKMFDCKSCGIEGGFKTFLREILRTCKEQPQRLKLKTLAKERGLTTDVLKMHRLTYNPHTKGFMLPIMAVNGKDIWDIRTYKNKKFMSLTGCSVGLFGWDQVDKTNTIYITEGEWDKFALEIMLDEKNSKATVLSTPGAQTFKQEWVSHFEKKDVIVCYDNDEPGKKGANKIHALLKNITKSIKFIHWPETNKSGYDVRDYFNDTAKTKTVRLKRLHKLLLDKPPYVENLKEPNKDEVELDAYTGEYTEPTDVYKVYKKWLYLESTDPIDVLFGTIIANRLEGDPLWLFLVAPPGGTKTELVNTCAKAPNIYTTSSLTSKSLVSGANIAGGGDPSLIPKLDKKVLIVKDFTTILNMPQLVRDEIFGILRDAYDGKTEKDFGNGLRRSYESHFGVVSAVTPVIDHYAEGNSSLGERFLRYNIPHSNTVKSNTKMMKKVHENSGKEVEMRSELEGIGTAVLSFDFTEKPTMPTKISDKLMALSQYIAIVRGTVIRNKYTGDVTHRPFSEFGTRMFKQFSKFMNGVTMFKGLSEITNKEYRLACDMGKATIPAKMEKMLEYIWYEDSDNDYTSKELSEALGLPLGTVATTADDLKMLGVLTKEMLGPGKNAWALSKDALFLIKTSEIYA